MNSAANPSHEAVGANFSLSAMVAARDLTFEAVHRIAAAIRPGMTEGAAYDLAEGILTQVGMDRLWHKTIVRFGEGTLKPFKALPDPDRKSVV